MGATAPYPDLASAMAVAQDGDRVLVEAGEWDANVSMNGRALTIEGIDGAAAVILRATGSKLLTVGGGSSLVVRDVTLDGASVAMVADVSGDSSFVLDGVVVRGALGPALKMSGPSSSIVAQECTFDGLVDGAMDLGDGWLTVTDSTFLGGSATKGAAIHEHGAVVLVERSTFVGNVADVGGAIFCNSGCTVRDSVFEANAATGDGGAVASFGPLVLEDSWFCANGAGGDGGAVALEGGGSLLSDALQDNVADKTGGAIWIKGTPSVRNLHLVGNESLGEGAALWMDGASEIISTLVAENTGPGVAVYAPKTLVTYSLFDGNVLVHTDAILGAGLVLDVDPQLAGYVPGMCGIDGLVPAAASAAIDAGDPTWLDADGSSSDIGAFSGWDAGEDLDGDGFYGAWDCDDSDPAVYPGVVIPWYVDADADGWGDPATAVDAACGEQPPGLIVVGGDCDDADGGINPGAAEICDAADVDEDCDGLADDADDAAVGRLASWVDADGDGFGDPATEAWLCDPGIDQVADGTDCDDTRADVSPAGQEVCDAFDVDEDCDGTADDLDPGGAANQTLAYVDADGDGFGDAATEVWLCDPGVDQVADGTDCDDTRADVNPAAQEVCDPDDVDEDCDGSSDDEDPSAVGGPMAYADADGDGFGDPATGRAMCDPTGRVTDATDCDDTRASVHPGAEEIDDDGIDQDCGGGDAVTTMSGGGCGCDASGGPGGSWLVILLALTLARTTVARAQVLDAHGAEPLPFCSDPSAPTVGWSAACLPDRGTLGVGTNGTWASEPLTLNRHEEGRTESVPLLADLVGASVGGVARPSPRLAVAVRAPIWLRNGAAPAGVSLGDAEVSAPLVLTRPEGASWVLVVPGLRLPTGAAARWLGAGSAGGSARVAAGASRDAWSAGAELGAVWAGSGVGEARGHVAWAPVESFGVHLEVWTRAPMYDGSAWPAEALLGFRGRRGAWSWSGGGARALSDGIGASPWRAWVGVGLATGRAPDVVAEDPPATEVAPAPLTVVDPAGRPIRGARLEADGVVLGETDHLGEIVADVPEGARLIRDGYTAVDVSAESPRIVMVRRPVEVQVRVVDPSGHALPSAEVTLVSPTDAGPGTMDAVGTRTWTLQPGEWTLTVGAEGATKQTRRFVLDETRTEQVQVDAVLVPAAGEDALSVRVADPAGRPVEDAMIQLDGQLVGSAGPSGLLLLEGVATGERRILARSPSLDGERGADVTLAPGSPGEATLAFSWPAGSVRVVARGPDGGVTDALAAFRGPSALPPAQLGFDGERVFQLRPGTWSVLVSSPALGAQERQLEVTDRPGELVDLEVTLQPPESGEVDLRLAIHDPDGLPVTGAEVLLDDQPIGRTAGEGMVTLRGLSSGQRELTVRHPALEPWSEIIELAPGPQLVEVPVRWVPGALHVTARGPDRGPVDALVAFAGAESRAPLPLGTDGQELVQLPVGDWELLVSSPSHGMQTRHVQVRDDGHLARVEVGLQPAVDDATRLALQVLGANGQPVPAEVTLNGRSLGRVGSDGRLEVHDLAPGRWPLEVTAEAHAPMAAELEVRGEVDHTVTLAWAPGAVELEVLDPKGEPVEDALVMVTGPRPIPPVQLDATGARVLGLAPGRWFVLVSSPTWGTAEYELLLEDAPAPTPLVVRLEPPRDDVAVLWLRVIDPSGGPVDGARVLVDGEEVGVTSASGSFLLQEALPGGHEVELQPPATHAGTMVPLTLEPGSQLETVVVDWRRTRLALAVTDTEDHAVPATVWLDGPVLEASHRVPDEGTLELMLPIGQWTVTADSEGFEPAKATLELTVDRPAAQSLSLSPERLALDENDALVLDDRVHFDLDSDVVRADARPVLAEVAAWLDTHPGVVLLEVQGHTDDSGTIAYNLDLSVRRAKAVRAALVALGVAPERLIARGYGVLRPIATDRALNRRVELVVTEEADR